MSAIKRMIEDKSEFAMMGRYVPVDSPAEAQVITDYILTALGFGNEDVDVEKHINRYTDGNPKHLNRVTHISVYAIEDMVIISYLLDNDADKDDVEWAFIPYDAKEYPYRFSYALNLTCPEFSELGDVCVMKNLDDTYTPIH